MLQTLQVQPSSIDSREFVLGLLDQPTLRASSEHQFEPQCHSR